MKIQEFYCDGCKQNIRRETRDDDCTTGYGCSFNPHTNKYDLKFCFVCCGERDKQAMIETGHSKNLPLYLSHESLPISNGMEINKRYIRQNFRVSNWCGTLVFPVKVHWTGNYNWYHVGKVDFIRFIGPDGAVWSGKSMGGFTQIVHCKRTKLTNVNA